MNRNIIISCTLIFGLSAVSMAYAQPPGSGSDAVASRYRAEAERQKRAAETAKVKPPKIEYEKEAAQPAVPEGPAFTLTAVEITGVTIFGRDEFTPLYSPLIGKQVTLKEMEAVAKKIESRYDERGYLTTNVYVPEQEIKDGKVRIEALEGRIGNVRIEDSKWFPSKLLRKYIHAVKNEIFNIQKLQKDILRINQNPDISVRAALEPSKEAGASDVVLKVKDKFPYHTGVGVDNQGTRLSGYYRTSLYFRSSDLTAHNDPLFVSVLLSKGSRGEFVGYTLPVDTRGNALGFDFSYFTSKTLKEYSPFDMTGDTLTFTPHMTNELYLAENFQASLESGIDIKSIKKKSTGSKQTDDQLRLLYTMLNFSSSDSFLGGGWNSFSPRFTFSAANFLGSSDRNHPNASRAATGGAFVVYEHDVSRTQRLPFESSLSIRSQLQLSSRTLPTSEQFQLGGANSVRGYPEGDYLADDGAVLNLDLLFPSFIFPNYIKIPMSDRPLRNQLQGVAFFDIGGGKINKVQPGELKNKMLMGIGGGLRFNFNSNLSIRTEWATALGGDGPTQGSGPSTFHLTCRYET